MNLHERANVVRAMDTLARAINNENILPRWLLVGVADGDVDGNETDEDLDFYCEDDTFAEIMGLFLQIMSAANKDGGLYVDGIVSE
jgi:hypothetical protein